jgi:wobble nucleotide-excising tRNase
MISQINIGIVATYNPSVTIDNLKKINFFFGYNGSGKSTIAKYLYNISQDTVQQDSKYDSCNQNGYNSSNHQLLIFNDDFTKRNFIQNNTLKGVFSLNEINEEIDTQIKDIEKLIKDYQTREINKKNLKININNARKNNEEELLDNCWKARNEFNTFTKIELQNKTKKSHLAKLKTYFDQLENIATLEELSTKYQTLYEKELNNISLNIDIKLYKRLRKLEITFNKLLSEVIVGNDDVDIANLIKKLDSKNWIKTGQQYLKQTDTLCPFCQKETIDEKFKEQLNEIFDETYTEKINNIKNIKIEYETLVNELLKNILGIQQVFNPENIVFEVYKHLEDIFNQNINTIEVKILNPNEKKTILSIKSLNKEFSIINKKIKENNDLYEELDEHKKSFIEKIWLYMADKCKNAIELYDKKEEKYQKIIEKANNLIENYQNKVIGFKEEIEELRKQTINTKEAVENINQILQNSGFDGFEIKEKSIENNISQYYLKRFNNEDTEIFDTLSEGEKNFISFLYFYQLCIGTDDILDNSSRKKIIVIDDPVSSLDSRVLFIVSTLIRKLIQRKANNPRTERKELKNNNIIQTFIFTHNLYFYKEVAFDKRLICMDISHYNIIKIQNKTNIEQVSSDKQIFDDYSLMWKSLKDIKGNLSNDKSMNIFIANTMRRIIESYVNFIGIGKNPWASLDGEDMDSSSYDIKSAFISMINDESHRIGALDNIYYQRIINEEPNILFNIFKELFDEIGLEHYNLMFEIEE